MLLRKLIHVVFLGVVLYFSVLYLDGVLLTDYFGGFIFSFLTLVFVFVVAELLVYPVVNLVILPLRFLTFGFASLALSVGLVYGISFLLPFFSVTSLWQLLLLGSVLGILRSVLR